ncbi:hypothetical protein FXO37_04737 [Capsicum annuum]|nr:hypothetical protein FXO37_04737 [Capsicum annuum]
MHKSRCKLKSARDILEEGSKGQKTRPIGVAPKCTGHILKISPEAMSKKEPNKSFSEDKLGKKERNLLMKAGNCILEKQRNDVYHAQLEKKKLNIDEDVYGGRGGESGSSTLQLILVTLLILLVFQTGSALWAGPFVL